MKKLFLLPLLSLFFLTACTLPSNNTTEPIPTEGIAYAEQLTVAWIWPDISFEPTVASDTLVLKKSFEDHSDHVFIDRQSRSNYLDIQEDLIPGNIVKFVGTVKALDAAAGNHYYQVTSIDDLIKVWIPTQEKVEELITQYSYCETDADCIGIYGQCPLSCQIAINKKYQEITERIITNFWNAQDPQCTYKCAEIKKVSCNKKSMCEVE